MTVEPPEPPQGAGEAQAQLDFAGFNGPAQCRDQVVVLALELDEPRRLACAEQLRRGPLGEIEYEPRMLVSGGLVLASALQPIQGVPAERFQHSETHVFAAVAAFTA